MILVGQYDSPFVRRVAVSLLELGLPYRQSPLSVFGDAVAMRAHNPLGRVPALVLGNGETLVDSGAILDSLDQMVEPERALLPLTGEARRHDLQLTAIATGVADKSVQLAYERILRPSALHWQEWIERVRGQLERGLAAMEDRAGELWPAGTRLMQPGITAACVWRYVQISATDLVPEGRYPGLERHSAACEALPSFKATWPDNLVVPRAS
ncbi:MAG: glutathione S-transferase N-terminal domain-containing protein [Geminicoccaceae bacterium]